MSVLPASLDLPWSVLLTADVKAAGAGPGWVDRYWWVGLWIAVSLVVRSWTWWSFARHYRAPAGLNPGETFPEVMAWGGIKIALLKEGVFLQQRRLPQWWLPPLLIPWTSVWKVHKKSAFWAHCLHIEINEEAGMMDLRIPQERAQAFCL